MLYRDEDNVHIQGQKYTNGVQMIVQYSGHLKAFSKARGYQMALQFV